MAITILQNLDDFARLPGELQQVVRRASDIEKIPYTRRTRQQEAFLASVEKRLDDYQQGTIKPAETTAAIQGGRVLSSDRQIFGPDIEPDPMPRVVKTPVLDSRGKPTGEFTRELYPLAPGTTYQTEVDLPLQLESMQGDFKKMNLTPFVYGANRDYSTEALRVRRDRPNIPARLQTEYDAVTEQAIEELSDQLRRVPEVSPSEASVSDTLADVYGRIIDGAPGTGFMPGFAAQRPVTDVPAFLLKAGATNEDAANASLSGFITRSDDKGSSFKRNVLVSPTETGFDLTTALAGTAANTGTILSNLRDNLSYIDTASPYDAGVTDRTFREVPFRTRAVIPGQSYSVLRDGVPVIETTPSRAVLVPRESGDFVQTAGWAGVGSGQARLPRIVQGNLLQEAPFGESGPEYLARVNQSRAEAQATETANRALRDQIARERIVLDREEAASLGQTETIIQPVQPGSLTREEAAEGAFDEYKDAINASLRVNPKGDILAPGLFSLGSGNHNVTQRTLIRQTPEGPVSVVGVPDNAGLSYPAGLTSVLQNPITLRTQSVSYRPGAFYRDTSTKPVQSDLVGAEETIEGQSEAARRPALLAFDVNPEDPGGLPQGEFGRRLFKPGDPLQFSTRISEGQAALRGQMQSIIDPIAAPTVVRAMDPLTAAQQTIDYLDEQMTRLEPFVQRGRQISASTPGKTKNNEYNIYLQQADTLRQQRQQLASLLRDHEELEVAKERFDQNLSAASNLAISPRSAETVTGLTADGQEVTVPLQDFMKDQRAQPTVSRFGIPLQSQGPRAIPGDTSGQYFEYGNPDAVSIITDWDKPVFQALVAADPTITPNQARRGVQWRQVRVPNSKAVKIEVINPGVPLTDASGAPIPYNPTQLVGYDSQVGPYVERKLPDNIESNRQIRQERLAAGAEGYTPLPISPNIPIKYNPARPGYPFALPEMRRTAYTPTPEPTSDVVLPLDLEAGRLSPAIPGPNLPLNRAVPTFSSLSISPVYRGMPAGSSFDASVTGSAITPRNNLPLTPGSEPAPRLQPAGVLRYQAPSALSSGRSVPLMVPIRERGPKLYSLEDQIGDLSQVDSLSAADPAGRNTLFNLANSLGITGTSLMDSSNDFGRLKDDIKATLTARYPDRFARNAQTFVTRLPADLSDPKDIQASIARSIDGRVETIPDPENPQATTTRYVPGYQVEQLKFQNLDPSQVMLGPGQDDSRLSQYALPAITARMRQNPQTAQNIFSYIENETRSLDSSIARNQAAAQRLSDLLNSPDQLRAALAGSRNPERDIANIQNSLRDFESEISRSTAYRQNLASNSEAIRRMLGY